MKPIPRNADSERKVMTNLEWMKAVLAETSPMSYLAAPFRAGEWLCVSDWHFLCAVKCDELAAKFEDKWNTIKVALDIIATPLVDSDCDLSHLKEWATRAEPVCQLCNGTKKVKCSECSGTGTVECECTCGDEHDAECEECDKGIADCICASKSSPALVFGEVLNVIVLERAIRNFSGPFQISQGHARGGKALVFGGDGWRAAVMPMKAEPKETYEPPNRRETVIAG